MRDKLRLVIKLAQKLSLVLYFYLIIKTDVANHLSCIPLKQNKWTVLRGEKIPGEQKEKLDTITRKQLEPSFSVTFLSILQSKVVKWLKNKRD